MMKNERIERLARMAAEIEEIEAEACGREAWDGDFAPAFDARPGVLASIGPARLLATAALVAIAAVGAWGALSAWKQITSARGSLQQFADVPLPERTPIVAIQKPATPASGSERATTIAKVEPAMATGSNLASAIKPAVIRPAVMTGPLLRSDRENGDCNIVIVIVHDMSGKSRCVEVREEDWNGRCASDLPEWELAMARRSIMPGCAKGSSRQVLVVALSGPAGALPTTQRGADDLAACILGMPRPCDSGGECYQNVTASCLPHDVSFKVETVALR